MLLDVVLLDPGGWQLPHINLARLHIGLLHRASTALSETQNKEIRKSEKFVNLPSKRKVKSLVIYLDGMRRLGGGGL